MRQLIFTRNGGAPRELELEREYNLEAIVENLLQSKMRPRDIITVRGRLHLAYNIDTYSLDTYREVPRDFEINYCPSKRKFCLGMLSDIPVCICYISIGAAGTPTVKWASEVMALHARKWKTSDLRVDGPLHVEIYSQSGATASTVEFDIRTLTGKCIRMLMPACVPVGELKTRIQEIEGIPEDQQRLVHSGLQLADENSLKHYNIVDNTTIHLILRLRGGMMHDTSGRTDFENMEPYEADYLRERYARMRDVMTREPFNVLLPSGTIMHLAFDRETAPITEAQLHDQLIMRAVTEYTDDLAVLPPKMASRLTAADLAQLEEMI